MLRFQLSGNNYCGGNIKRMRLWIGDKAFDYEYICGASLPQPWVAHVREFTAVGGPTVISFESLSSSFYCGPTIDGVCLDRICPGDLDNSNSVTGVDLAIVLTNWNAPNPKYPQADVNGDGAVDGADLAIVLSNWGDCP